MIPTRRFTFRAMALLGLGLLPGCPDNTTTTSATDTDASTGSTTEDATTNTPTTTPPTTDTPPTTTDPTTGTGTTTDDPTGTTTNPITTGETEATSTTAAETTETAGSSTTGGPALTLCDKLGGETGIGELVTGAFGVILADDKVNGYFLNSDVDAGNLGACLIKQLGELATCPGVVYDCQDMKTAHAGLGISTADFMDFATDFSAALDTHQQSHPNLDDADKTAIMDALGTMLPDIVEDADNNLTVYQRVGRKPAIKALVGKPAEAGSFVDNVANNAAINGFFGASDFDRLNTCLTRQVSGIDGPIAYGLEVDAPMGVDPGAGLANPCLDMATSHMGLVDANDNIGIDINDFGALVGDLITAMNTFMVAQTDQDAILGVLGPMCSDILAPEFKNDCPGNKKDETVEAAMVALPIPDDAYTGGLETMACVDLQVADDGINVVLGAEVTVALDHTWIGDVTMKVQSPTGTILTILSRPGLNEMLDGQNQCCGDSSNFGAMFPLLFKNGAANQAENMGAAIVSSNGIVCKDEVPALAACEWTPNPGKGPGMSFADFVGENAVGTWKVCVGDGGAGDTGTLQSAKLVLNKGKFAPP